jgi:hypothetical protein
MLHGHKHEHVHVSILSWVFPDWIETGDQPNTSLQTGVYSLEEGDTFIPGDDYIFFISGIPEISIPGELVCRREVLWRVNKKYKYVAKEPTDLHLFPVLTPQGNSIRREMIYYIDGWVDTSCEGACIIFTAQKSKEVFSSIDALSMNISIRRGIFGGDPLYVYITYNNGMYYTSPLSYANDLFMKKRIVQDCEDEIPRVCRRHEQRQSNVTYDVTCNVSCINTDNSLTGCNTSDSTGITNEDGVVISTLILDVVTVILCTIIIILIGRLARTNERSKNHEAIRGRLVSKSEML